MIGALLAGGAGRRLDASGAKAAAEVAGRPLASYPVAALGAVCDRVAVVCKADTALPGLAGVERWDEPDEPRHPVIGIIHALERARAPVLVCAADMPYVTADACRVVLRAAASADAAATVAARSGRLEPLLGVYTPAALETLLSAVPDAPLTELVATLDPLRVALPGRLLASVNTPAQLAAAERVLAGR